MLNSFLSWQAHSQRSPCLCQSLMRDPPARSLHTSLVVSILILPNEFLGVTIKICSLNNPSCLLPLGLVLNRAYMAPWTLTTRIECSQNFMTETELRTHKE